MRGERFICLSGEDRLIRDADPGRVPREDRKHTRKGTAT
jgi:FdhD protein